MKCLYPQFINGNIVRCRKCSACLRTRIQEWILRLSAENERLRAYFITLTYDDVHLPRNGVDKPEIQRFFKRLRNDINFKYYLISEYGPNTFRPHYHGIFFADCSNDDIYNLVLKHWHNGNIMVDDCNIERLHYVCSYHITKTFNPLNLNENFVVMSKKLGANFLTSNRIEFFTKYLQLTSHYLGYRQGLPRYFKDRIRLTPEELESINLKDDGCYSPYSPEEQKRIQARQKIILNKIIYKKNKI